MSVPSISNQPILTQRDELEEMLSHPPGWILHSGISIVFFFIMVGLILSWLIRYPDELPARMTIVQATPPHELKPLLSSKLDTIFYADGASVKAGDRIVILKSAAQWYDVDLLWKRLQEQDNKTAQTWPQDLSLGNLQNFYSNFLDANSDLEFFDSRILFQNKKLAAKKEIASLEQLDKLYIEQRDFFLAEKKLIEQNKERVTSLHQDGVSSAIELEEQQKQLLQYQQRLKSLEVNLLQNRLRIQQLEAQIIENKDEYLRTQNALQLARTQAKRQLIGAIEEWYTQHVLISPISGKLEWKGQLSYLNTVQAGELLGTILPEKSTSQSIAQLQMGAMGIGKLEVGAPVKISLDAYPKQEFGQITAQVDEINYAPLKNEEATSEYMLKVFLPDPLITSYGKSIPITPNMPGQAIVITKDRRILERIFEQFLSVFNNT